MAMEEYLLFALAVIYFVIPYGHRPSEHHPERQHKEDNRSNNSQHGAA